jgi:hypothetical protein
MAASDVDVGFPDRWRNWPPNCVFHSQSPASTQMTSRGAHFLFLQSSHHECYPLLHAGGPLDHPLRPDWTALFRKDRLQPGTDCGVLANWPPLLTAKDEELDRWTLRYQTAVLLTQGGLIH